MGAEMSRFETVQSVLVAELAKPYIYGESDCFFLGCQMADALDPSRGMVGKYRRSYRTLAGAQRALRKRGHKSLTTFFAAHLEPTAPAQAMFGDLAIVVVDGGEHVAICLGDRFTSKTASGEVNFRLPDCVAAFRL